MNNEHCSARQISDGDDFVLFNLTNRNRTIFNGNLFISIVYGINAGILYISLIPQHYNLTLFISS